MGFSTDIRSVDWLLADDQSDLVSTSSKSPMDGALDKLLHPNICIKSPHEEVEFMYFMSIRSQMVNIHATGGASDLTPTLTLPCRPFQLVVASCVVVTCR